MDRHCPPNEVDTLLTAACSLLDKDPPPSLTDIVGAYKTKGGGDRDLLLAMLNAKSAEDQRLANFASLQRSVLDIYSRRPPPSPPMDPRSYDPYYNDHFPHRYSIPHHSHSRSGHSRHHHHPRPRSISPPHPYHAHHTAHSSHHILAPPEQPPRKRHRAVSPRRSPPPLAGPGLSNATLPPSPYSSHSSVGSAESPHLRGSMTINSLLRAGDDERHHHYAGALNSNTKRSSTPEIGPNKAPRKITLQG